MPLVVASLTLRSWMKTGCTVGPDYGEGFLRESDPVHEVSIVLDVLDTDGVAMEFAVGGDQRDLRGTVPRSLRC